MRSCPSAAWPCGLCARSTIPTPTVKVVEGANHGYMGREKELMETIYPVSQRDLSRTS